MLLAITAGEPAGIGPDIILQLASRNEAFPSQCNYNNWLVFADIDLLRERAATLNLNVPLIKFHFNQPQDTPDSPALKVFHIPLIEPCRPGELNQNNASYVIKTLIQASDACLQGHCHALVTGPIQKSIFFAAGIPFSGHTEWLAQYTKMPGSLMFFVNNAMKVALLTTHIPLAQVPQAVTAERLQFALQLLHAGLKKYFAIANPRILVCGLNPHAGEGGHLGQEENTVIIPTLNLLRQQGMDLLGPLPADTTFLPATLQQGDAVLALYHDQALPVIKSKYFDSTVNLTLGLPFLRTSVDHGTALALAGSGNANPSSLAAAIALAEKL